MGGKIQTPQETLPASGPQIKWEDFPSGCRDEFCRAFLKGAVKAFENPEVSARYERWLKERKEKEQSVRQDQSALMVLNGAAVIVTSSDH